MRAGAIAWMTSSADREESGKLNSWRSVSSCYAADAAVLQAASLRQALSGIAELGLINAETMADIRADYVYLRRLENRIQAQRDQQTHCIPAGEDLQRLAQACGVASESALMAQIAAVRERVTRRFHAMFPSQPAPSAQPKWVEAWHRVQTDQQSSGADESLEQVQPLSVFLRSLDRLASAMHGAG
jgi:glutamate-ammonia-ligase adenylyltransferase